MVASIGPQRQKIGLAARFGKWKALAEGLLEKVEGPLPVARQLAGDRQPEEGAALVGLGAGDLAPGCVSLVRLGQIQRQLAAQPGVSRLALDLRREQADGAAESFRSLVAAVRDLAAGIPQIPPQGVPVGAARNGEALLIGCRGLGIESLIEIDSPQVAIERRRRLDPKGALEQLRGLRQTAGGDQDASQVA